MFAADRYRPVPTEEQLSIVGSNSIYTASGETVGKARDALPDVHLILVNSA
jgi:hypothetical protein